MLSTPSHSLQVLLRRSEKGGSLPTLITLPTKGRGVVSPRRSRTALGLSPRAVARDGLFGHLGGLSGLPRIAQS
jgi:hypothetical protein